MQWILQQFEDTHKLAEALDAAGIAYTWHKAIPFTDQITPEPTIPNRENVVIFGAYSMWRYAQRMMLSPGVFRITPFVHEKAWQPYLLNGIDALFCELQEIPDRMASNDKLWFMRPVDDSKAEPGKVRTSREIIALAEHVKKLGIDDIAVGSLRHDTLLMLTEPRVIHQEWRLWIIGGKLQTYSLYKLGNKIIYKHEIDDDALEFAHDMIARNPNYAEAYVMDICRSDEGIKIIETNCINAAGFYAADLNKLVKAIQALR